MNNTRSISLLLMKIKQQTFIWWSVNSFNQSSNNLTNLLILKLVNTFMTTIIKNHLIFGICFELALIVLLFGWRYKVVTDKLLAAINQIFMTILKIRSFTLMNLFKRKEKWNTKKRNKKDFQLHLISHSKKNSLSINWQLLKKG